MMDKKEYWKYLNSEHWKNKKNQRIEKDGHKCAICGSGDNLNVHHWSYEHLGHESEYELVTLCRQCHTMFHRKQKELYDLIKPVENKYLKECKEIRYKYDVETMEILAHFFRNNGVTSGYSTNKQRFVFERILPWLGVGGMFCVSGLTRLLGILANKKKPGKANTVEQWKQQWMKGG